MRIFHTQLLPSQTQERNVLEGEDQQIPRTPQMAGLRRWDGRPGELERPPHTNPPACLTLGGVWEAPTSLASFLPAGRPWDLPEVEFWGSGVGVTETPAAGRGDFRGPKAGASGGGLGQRDMLGQYFHSVISRWRPMRPATFSKATFAFV